MLLNLNFLIICIFINGSSFYYIMATYWREPLFWLRSSLLRIILLTPTLTHPHTHTHTDLADIFELSGPLTTNNWTINKPWAKGDDQILFPGKLEVSSQRKAKAPIPVLLPKKFHGWRSLVGYSPWVSKSRTWLSDFASLLVACNMDYI